MAVHGDDICAFIEHIVVKNCFHLIGAVLRRYRSYWAVVVGTMVIPGPDSPFHFAQDRGGDPLANHETASTSLDRSTDPSSRSSAKTDA